MNWRTMTLGDVVTLQRGYDLPEQDRHPGAFPIVGSAGANGWHDKANVLGPGVVIGRSGAGFGSAHYCEGDFWALNTGLFVSDFRKNHPKFVFYLLDYLDFTEYNSGGAQPSLNRNFIYPIEVRLPPPNEQAKIADTLTNWDIATQSAEKLIAAKELCHRALHIRLLGKSLWSKSRHERADALFSPVSERNRPDLPVLAVTQGQGVVPRSMLDRRITMELSDPATFKVVRKDDFVISLRSFQGGLEHSAYEGLVSPAYTVLRCGTNLNPRFYRHYLKSPDFLKRLAVAVIGIRDGKQINFTDFASIKLPLPQPERQAQIATILDESEKEIALLRKQTNQLRTQKRGLMQKLLTGQWRVKVPEAEAA